MLILQVTKSKGGRNQWLTHQTTYQPHLWRHNNNWISMPAPKAHTRQYSAKIYQTLCVPLYFWSAHPMRSQKPAIPTPKSRDKETVTSKQEFFCPLLYWALMNNSSERCQTLWGIQIIIHFRNRDYILLHTFTVARKFAQLGCHMHICAYSNLYQ